MADVINYLIRVLEQIPTNIILVALITYLAWFNKYYSKRHDIIRERLRKTEECVQKSKETDNEILMLVLKALITNDNLPDFVRLDFYKNYKSHNGNSWVDGYVEDNIIKSNKHYKKQREP